MKMTLRSLSVLILFFGWFQSTAQNSVDIISASAPYLPSGVDSIEYVFLKYDYSLGLDSNGYKVTFNIHTVTRKSDCVLAKPYLASFCSYQRILLILGLAEARQLKTALAGRHYDENYKNQISQTADSVFRRYHGIFKLCNTETENGMSASGLQKWALISLELLQKHASPSEPLALEQRFTANGELPNTAKYTNPKNFLYKASRTIVFEDRFFDNRNGWIPYDTATSELAPAVNIKPEITDGKFTIDNKSEKRFGFYLYPEVDFQKDFEINLDFEILSSQKKSYYAPAFFWGYDTSSADQGGTWIGVNRLDEYSLTFCHGGNHLNDEHHHFTKFSDENIQHLTIRKIGDWYYFFVNGDFKRSYPFHPLPGNEWSLAAEERTAVVYRNLKVSYLN